MFSVVCTVYPVREVRWLSWRHCNRKASFLKCFTSSLKTQSQRFQILSAWREFQRGPFSLPISVDCRLCRFTYKWNGVFSRQMTNKSKFYCQPSKEVAIISCPAGYQINYVSISYFEVNVLFTAYMHKTLSFQSWLLCVQWSNSFSVL